MRLRPDARGAVTLGPHMRRDKLMQAAWRMRQLTGQQTVVLVGTNEVTRLVRKCCCLEASAPVTPRDIMQWVHKNTADGNLAVRYCSKQRVSCKGAVPCGPATDWNCGR